MNSLQIRQMLNKVPEVTIYFWIIKILCTTVGETAADYLNQVLHFGLTGTSLVMSVLLIIVMFFQFKTKKYIPSIYWLVVVKQEEDCFDNGDYMVMNPAKVIFMFE